MSDRQQDVISQTGVWVDTETGQVVESEPEAGRLIVPPGGIVDQRVLDEIEAAKTAAGPVVEEPTEDEEDAETEEDERPRRGRPPGSKNKPKEQAAVADDTEKAVE